MTVDPQLGVVTWQPTASQAGLSVTAPSITSTAPTSVTAGLTYRYDVQASDFDNDPLT